MNQLANFNNWEDVCAAQAIDPIKAIEWADQVPEEHRKSVLAFYQIANLSKVSWGDKQPNWSDTNERKYYPYFDMNDEDNASGFGFSHAHYDYWYSYALVGSRLVFPTREWAEHAGKQFIAWYRDMMVLPK